MMSIAILIALIALPLAILLVERKLRNGKRESFDWVASENMPITLQRSALVMSEQPIAMRDPVALHGVVDQVFDTGKVLIPVDTKTRPVPRVYESDVLQLSIYRTILISSQNRPVANYGYVRVVCPSNNGNTTIRYIKTKLHNPAHIEKMYRSNINDSFSVS